MIVSLIPFKVEIDDNRFDKDVIVLAIHQYEDEDNFLVADKNGIFCYVSLHQCKFKGLVNES